MRVSYVLPLRAERSLAATDLTPYLAATARLAEILVVDGSAPDVFAAHAAAWGALVRHLRVDADLEAPVGKVGGVLTGVRHATHERIVIADDDVRYDAAGLVAVATLLDAAHVVRPQNVFRPMPWHARWDTARTLLNRATGGDWPGTLGVRRSALVATGGYDGRALFENLELVRTVVAAGGVERVAPGVFVERRPPETPHFLGQRVRQAYDEFARPRRLAVQLALLPTIAAAVAGRRWRILGAGVAASVVLAEIGRRRGGGVAVFPADTPLWAPLWLGERAVCSWLAAASRLRWGGVRYGDRAIRLAATPMRVLRRRHAGSITATSMGLNEPLFESSAEQAVTPTTMSISARSSR